MTDPQKVNTKNIISKSILFVKLQPEQFNKSIKKKYRISANSFRGNYSFLNLTLCTVTFDHSTYRCGNYSREETIQGRKLFKGGNYSWKYGILNKFYFISM